MRGSIFVRATALGILIVAMVVVMGGCSGTSTTTVRQNVSERAAVNPVSGRIAFASPGATGLLYIWDINANGANMTLLTPADNDNDLSDEGGWHPAYSPNGELLAIASRRGGTPSIYLIDAASGDRALLQRVTPETGTGLDEMPNWHPSGDSLIYASTRPDGNYDIRTINSDGSGLTELIATAAEEKWPCYNPVNPDQVVFQSDAAGNTDIWVYTISTATAVNITAGSPFRDEAPSWSPDGTAIVFHSDRGGFFDIWKVAPDGSGLTQLTNDARSDGYPVWNGDGSRIIFTRNREVWSMNPDGSDQKQLTRRPV